MSVQLAKLLREDSVAQAACADLVGLDFDPFLNSQDPAPRYEVGGISRNEQTFRAEIYGMQSGRRSAKPSLSAEFRESDGHWFFVNFYYPNGTNLLAILKSPRLPCSTPRRSGR
jgi:hypothetical protein